jgi:hypothetical protein
MKRLLFGDNLQWLRDAKLFPAVSVDVVYLSRFPNAEMQLLVEG